MKKRLSDSVKNGYVKFMKNAELDTDDSFLMELNSSGILTVRGSKDIIAFDENRIILQCKDFFLDIKGKDLSILSFSKNSTAVSGKTESIIKTERRRKEDE
ncbi:MAG: YabP/YqfC family sporulation protein [Clostridia bacterium]|nr:YabP/YqfC family sporulation protein [Clostridia bacterium]